jgi:hypothetical protein
MEVHSWPGSTGGSFDMCKAPAWVIVTLSRAMMSGNRRSCAVSCIYSTRALSRLLNLGRRGNGTPIDWNAVAFHPKCPACAPLPPRAPDYRSSRPRFAPHCARGAIRQALPAPCAQGRAIEDQPLRRHIPGPLQRLRRASQLAASVRRCEMRSSIPVVPVCS